MTPKTSATSLTALISIDISGWIERFTKGPKAAKYKTVIESTKPKDIVTSVVVLYEVYKKIKKLKGEEEALLAVAALSQTTVVPIDQTISLEAADYSLEYSLHFSDALVYATARHYKAQLYTSDDDLRPLKMVCFI
ncbi:MAG: type II toxin-antitoxin system VapC family toxin [Candidatus Bathyarchaeota archaeon]|nr:type II toxin-antitoxin system VapC family toxin [Candidatus Bathyarchaeota archaeon]